MASQRAHLKAILGIGLQQCPSPHHSSLRKILPVGSDNGGGGGGGDDSGGSAKDGGEGDVGGGDGSGGSGGRVGSGSIAGHGCNISTQHSV